MARGVADTEMIRRQNRDLVLDALRRHGALSRSEIAMRTGLSNASLTAIGSDLIAQGIIVEIEEKPVASKGRGRPAVKIALNRPSAFVILIELDVNRCKLSLLDYGGILVDRIESAVTPNLFSEIAPDVYLRERVATMLARNREIAARLRNISISVQGILEVGERSLHWTPIPFLANVDIVSPLELAFSASVHLFKRGRLMADGVRWLYPDLDNATVATIFIGSTVGMGLSFPATDQHRTDIGTEFGHMNHMPDGALCRCGARGCIEAYAGDYAILRAAYSVPEHTTPAPSVPAADFQQIAARARHGDRNAISAFARAGRAIGFGLTRLMSIIPIDQVIVLGPGASAFDLMKAGIDDSARASLVGKVAPLPAYTLIGDAGEPVHRGLMMKALTGLDRNIYAVMTEVPRRDIAQ